MKLSIFTTTTNPLKRGDNVMDAMECYLGIADEVVCVDGSSIFDKEMSFYYDHPNYKLVEHEWPMEFNWRFIGEQFQRGYEACTGDWVIRMDLDSLFHEDDFERIRQTLEIYSEFPAVSFIKRQYILPDRFNIKSRLVVAVNKKQFGERIRFDGGGDLCQPTLDGVYIEPGDVPDIKIPIYNYECILKTKEQLLEDKGRFARAWHKHFGEYKLGGPDDESAYNKWYQMVVGRMTKPHERTPLFSHPMFMVQTIKNLKPHNWGYSGFGLEVNSYV